MEKTPAPRIIYLDQNKWIDLLRAENSPSEHPKWFALLEKLKAKKEANEVVLPLTSTNIYETYKIGDPDRRKRLAHLLAELSGGLVFRGRHRRLEVELSAVLAETHGAARSQLPEWWFLSDVFYEAFAEMGDERTGLNPSERLLDFIHKHPASFLYDHLSTATDAERAAAVKRWSDGSETEAFAPF